MWFPAQRVVRLFLWSLVFGAAAGAYYDIFRILRIARKPRGDGWRHSRFLRHGDAALCFAGDLFFWLSSAAAYCVFIYDLADGRLRIASLIAVCLGFLFWFFTFGRLIVAAADLIIRAVRAAICAVCSVTVVPAAKGIRFIARKLAALFAGLFGAVYSRVAIRRELRLASRGYGFKKEINKWTIKNKE